ncbi:uncharacterized protein B0I36DRAFT_248924 [Microdochium trichocladiopsis]|uniref:Uncharacterized protein n=1 Tax=Microdochium trichocladiopsis TaxID=1682393 RepID=A0A9P8Y1V0_9PEZI|nr:uncharacterized protein B0I36DRAFT_248924 [Microdochium trichocladiopsis]KAH7026521.1 hypothetical protein B0I36DRAFT_248924 [Microdochium trichocladiopsis]
MSGNQQSLSGSATMPRGFHYNADGMSPRTPEPMAMADEVMFPTAPRPRLRLKRRHVSQLTAPTEQFLASVAAADVPIPSIEEPENFERDQDMKVDIPKVRVQDLDAGDIYSRFQIPRLSPPKTPAPAEIAPALLPALRFPNWSLESTWSSSDLESSPDYESSRPSTAFSTQTSTSLFSHISQLSDDDDLLSPEDDHFDLSYAKPAAHEQTVKRQTRQQRRLPWTPAMSQHLWSVYTLYLQDPRVTPIRLGKSNIPPHGVCLRVAREAKRSWRGTNSLSGGVKSRDLTPTANEPKPFVQWPHSSAATRSHLRELCKRNAAAKFGRNRYMSRSPTPFHMHRPAAERRHQRSISARSSSVFAAHDMAVSLVVSTSDAMQPQGPLAQLTMSEPEFLPPLERKTPVDEPTEPFPDLSPMHDPSPMASLPSPITGEDERLRLGSPFTYGPSSSSSLAAQINPRARSSTVGARKLLKSPVRLTRSRSGTQKRRSTRAADDHLHRKRPSLATAFGRELSEALGISRSNASPPPPVPTALRTTPQSPEVISSSSAVLPDPFIISRPGIDLTQQPARLGSPFSASANSQTFPHRLSAPVHFDMGVFRRPFATVHQPIQPEPGTPSRRASLMSRLSHLDQRLRDFRHRSTEPRRSQSPP